MQVRHNRKTEKESKSKINPSRRKKESQKIKYIIKNLLLKHKKIVVMFPKIRVYQRKISILIPNRAWVISQGDKESIAGPIRLIQISRTRSIMAELHQFQIQPICTNQSKNQSEMKRKTVHYTRGTWMLRVWLFFLTCET